MNCCNQRQIYVIFHQAVWEPKCLKTLKHFYLLPSQPKGLKCEQPVPTSTAALKAKSTYDSDQRCCNHKPMLG